MLRWTAEASSLSMSACRSWTSLASHFRACTASAMQMVSTAEIPLAGEYGTLPLSWKGELGLSMSEAELDVGAKYSSLAWRELFKPDLRAVWDAFLDTNSYSLRESFWRRGSIFILFARCSDAYGIFRQDSTTTGISAPQHWSS